MKNEIYYLKGDATSPIGTGNHVIAHICNDINKWGKGFVLALSNKWSNTKTEYHKWFSDVRVPNHLGKVQFVQVEDDIVVANMVAQHSIYPSSDGVPPIRYKALVATLTEVGKYAKKHNAIVHMPKIGTGLAGGDWRTIEKIINTILINDGVKVCVYTL